jgi:hypothetical protein
VGHVQSDMLALDTLEKGHPEWINCILDELDDACTCTEALDTILTSNMANRPATTQYTQDLTVDDSWCYLRLHGGMVFVQVL